MNAYGQEQHMPVNDMNWQLVLAMLKSCFQHDQKGQSKLFARHTHRIKKQLCKPAACLVQPCSTIWGVCKVPILNVPQQQVHHSQDFG